MPPKKKLTKKEKARLEAEQAELLRQEMEKERLRKLEEERRRKQIEMEQAKRRQQEEIKENSMRRAQLKNSMAFFSDVLQRINVINAKAKEQRDWAKFMRCNGLPNANSPSDLRKYLHQWQLEMEHTERTTRNWLLRTDERTLLTQDTNVPDLTRATLRKQQGNLGDLYAQRIKEVLGILEELDDALIANKKPMYILTDLKELKTEIRGFLADHIDEFSYKIMSNIERDMEIDRPGVSKHIFTSDVFKSFIWTYSKDAQISLNPKARIGEQLTHNEVDFPILELQITLPPTVKQQSSSLRGLWLNYDHFTDYCASFSLKRPRPKDITILMQTKKEWRKRKEILQNMFDDCNQDAPVDSQENSSASQKPAERSFDVDKLYAAYEDEINKARLRAMGPQALGLQETDINLRKYRIIGGIYCIDHLETPDQDKRLNSKSFIRTINSPNKLTHKQFYELYKPPPPVQPGVRRLPEEIEAEMRMIEAALDKLPLVTVQLPDSVIWFEPPVPCRWETQIETLESDMMFGAQATAATAPSQTTPTETNSPISTANPSPLKSSPRFTARLRKGFPQQQATPAPPLPVWEMEDFDMLHMPTGIDIYGLLQDFVKPRLPQGFCMRIQSASEGGANEKQRKRRRKPKQKFLFLARHKSIFRAQGEDDQECRDAPTHGTKPVGIDERCLEPDGPREMFPVVKFEKLLVFKEKENLRNTVDGKEAGQRGEKQCENDFDTKSPESGGENSNKNLSARAKVSGEATYMFSQLLADLDRLAEQQYSLQGEAPNPTSGNPTTAPSSAGSKVAEQVKEEGAHSTAMEAMVSLQAAFTFYPGISFDFDPKSEQKDGEDAEQVEQEADSSSEFDEDEGYDEEEYLGLRPRHKEDDSHSNRQNEHANNDSESSKSQHFNPLLLRQGKWSVRDVHDTKFNEDKFSIQFRTGRLGVFGFALNRYSNMPYQAWEVKPDFKSPGSILFSFTASIISLEVAISSAGYCMNNFQGAASTAAINEMIGRTLSLEELRATLVAAAVNIFPDEDAFCYTEGTCEKNYVMEMHLYACMATLALSHNFGWSRWNLLAGSRTAVLLMRELIEGKKVPYHSTLLVTPLKAAIIDCTEVSASFNAAGISGMAYYADLYQLSQVYALPSSLEKQRNMDPVLRDNVARVLMAIRPLSFC